MFKLFSKHSVLKLWTWLTFILLLIPTVSSTYTIVKVSGTLNENLINNNASLLNNMRNTLDGVFADTEYIRRILAENASINEIASAKEVDRQTRFTLGTLSLGNLLSSYRYVDSFYVYYPHLDIVISPDGFYESARFYMRYLNQTGENYEKWRQSLQNCNGMKTYESTMMYERELKETVEIMISMNEEKGSNKYVVNIRMRKEIVFRDILSAYPNKGSAAAVFTGNGSLLFQYGFADGGGKIGELDLKNPFEIYDIKLDGVKMNVSYVRSSVNRYRYFYATPANEALREMKNTIITIMLSAFLSIALMLVLLYYFNRWNYENNKHIIENFHKINDTDVYDINEYSFINHLIRSIGNKKNELEKIVEKAEDTNKNIFLSNYIKGYVDVIRTDEFERNDISFPYNRFALAAFHIRNISLNGHGPLSDAVFFIDNMMRDVVNNNLLYLVKVEADGTLYYIVNASESVDIRENIRQAVSNVLKVAHKHFELDFLVAISTTAGSVTAVPELYKEATAAIDYGIFYGIDEFISYDEVKTEPKSEFISICDVPNKSALLHLISNGKTNAALETIEKLLSQKVNGKYLQEWQLNCLTYNLIDTILESIDRTESNSYTEILNYTSEILNCSNTGEIKDFFRTLIKFCVEYNMAKGESEDNTYYKLKNLVDKNITNSDLCTQWIGQELNMSPNYLSKLFKKCSGVKLNNYINICRVDIAKKMLLRDKRLKIDDVVSLVGFNGKRTFLQVFKDIEGITPTQYRSLK